MLILRHKRDYTLSRPRRFQVKVLLSPRRRQQRRLRRLKMFFFIYRLYIPETGEPVVVVLYI